jgi:hypothetical protein
VRTTVILDNVLFQEATKTVLAEWLARSEPPPRRWKTLVIEEGLKALLADPYLGRRLRDTVSAKPKTLTIIVDEDLLKRAEAAVIRHLGGERERARMAGAVINHGLRALLRRKASRRLAELARDATGPARNGRKGQAG